jgi:hypothetical protein
VQIRFFTVLADVEAFGFSAAFARSGITRPISFSRTKLIAPL